MSDAEYLARTPLYELHVELGAKLVPFAGYEMPVQYPMGVLKEHQHTRHAAGLFDVSHMGQVELRGNGVDVALEGLVPADIIDLPVGQQRYALFTNCEGGILDDLMVTRQSEHLALVVNAAVKQQDLEHLRQNLPQHDVLHKDERALLALQGPAAPAERHPIEGHVPSCTLHENKGANSTQLTTSPAAHHTKKRDASSSTKQKSTAGAWSLCRSS